MKFNLFRRNAFDDWLNGSFDDEGGSAVCGRCFTELRWKSDGSGCYCPECEQELDRSDYFNYIGAQPPGSDCVYGCTEPYPQCKQFCDRYSIDPDDPMLQ